jgi:lipopolysaccharide/colanic/teichoic acid biosynthesis glycosyltransferase
MSTDARVRAFDLALAVLLLPALAPFAAGTAAVVLLCLGRPVLYAGRRVGRHGVEYVHYKFRTMCPGPEVGRVFFEQARLGRCGRLLRTLHLDELPELWHILRGEMSFVGPRPLPRSLLSGLDSTVREQVPPGWTGPAQIWLLERGRLDKRHQIELDNHYVERRSLGHNLRLLATTLLRVVRPAALDLRPDASFDRRRFATAERTQEMKP